MLTWSEKPNKYIAAAGFHLTAKSKDAIILTADVDKILQNIEAVPVLIHW